MTKQKRLELARKAQRKARRARAALKVPTKLVGRENAAEAMTRHLRKNHGYFGAAAEVKAGGRN